MIRNANAVKPKRYSENGDSEEVNEIFNDLRKAIDGLEKIVKGQRKINGNFYAVLESVINKLEYPPSSRKREEGVYPEISPKRVRSLVEAVPAINPPGCQDPERPGGN
jgi:hypothetical protein